MVPLDYAVRIRGSLSCKWCYKLQAKRAFYRYMRAIQQYLRTLLSLMTPIDVISVPLMTCVDRYLVDVHCAANEGSQGPSIVLGVFVTSSARQVFPDS